MKAENFEIVAYYPYTSIVTNTILSQSHNYETPEHLFIQKFADEIKAQWLEKLNVWDNKVVIEVREKRTKTHEKMFNRCSSFFIGYKDNIISIGLGMYQPDSYTSNGNIQILGNI
jgi:hypothetical protein